MSDNIQSCFERYEKKYRITQEQQMQIINGMQTHMQADKFGNYTICNIYYDTDDWQLVRASIEKPIYKEKLRVRSYGVPDGNSSLGPAGTAGSYYRALNRMNPKDIICADSVRQGGAWPQTYNIHSGTGDLNTGSNANKVIHLRHSGFTRAHGVIVDGHVERMDMGYLKGLGLYHCTNFPAFQDAWND